MYFKLKEKAGSHCETNAKGDVQTYKASDGHIFDTDRDLVAMFPNKFEKVEVVTEESLANKGKIVKMAETKAPKPKSSATVKSPFGIDVTEDYPTAKDDDLRVFEAKEGFTVVEADQPEKALNPKPLKADKVKAFVKKYLSE